MATRKKILSETEELHQQTQMSETTADAVPAVTIPANTQRVQEMELEIATLRATLAERETSYDLYVNERKLIEAELRDSRDMLKATLEAIPDLMFEVGLDGHYYACHAPASNLLYAPIVELVGHKIPKVVPPTVAVIVMEAIEEAHQKGFSFGKCYELNVPTGRCWFEISVARKAATSMEPRFILLVRDITARKKAEESLRVSQARYHALVDQSCEALTLVDIEKQEIVEINRRFTELLGYSLPEDAPLYANTFVVEPQSDTDRRYKTTLPGQRYLPPEIVTYRHKNGTEMPIERVGTVITIDGKDWALFSNRDMTERKKYEEAMRRSTQIQSVLREIAEAAVFAPSLPELYAKVHSLMNAVLPAKLFHINLPAFRNNKIE